ncbi:MAG: dihydrofolate reductase [Candidatus Pacearchaeota archaeon]
MDLSIIVAFDENFVIGNDKDIPWRMDKEGREKYSLDMQRFASLTTGHPVISGKVTYFSVPRKFRPLDNRQNIIVTSTTPESMLEEEREKGEVYTAQSFEEALQIAEQFDTLAYAIGGEGIYSAAFEHATRMDLTRIKESFEGNVYFPQPNWDNWKLTAKQIHEDFDFETYVRK